jgi:hypothetical protein
LDVCQGQKLTNLYLFPNIEITTSGALLCKNTLNLIGYSVDDGFFVEEVDGRFGGMDVHVYRVGW